MRDCRALTDLHTSLDTTALYRDGHWGQRALIMKVTGLQGDTDQTAHTSLHLMNKGEYAIT